MVASFLYPFLRDMLFWENPAEREQFKTKAETLVRAMCSEQNMELSALHNSSGMNFHSPGTIPNEVPENQQTSAVRKRRKFSLKNHISNNYCRAHPMDEVSRYKGTEISQFGLQEDSFLSNLFSVIQFGIPEERCTQNL